MIKSCIFILLRFYSLLNTWWGNLHKSLFPKTNVFFFIDSNRFRWSLGVWNYWWCNAHHFKRRDAKLIDYQVPTRSPTLSLHVPTRLPTLFLQVPTRLRTLALQVHTRSPTLTVQKISPVNKNLIQFNNKDCGTMIIDITLECFYCWLETGMCHYQQHYLINYFSGKEILDQTCFHLVI